MVVIESIFYGCPVIISKQVDIFKKLERYRVAKAFDLKKVNLSSEIKKCILQKDFKDYVAENGKKVINNLYSWEKIAKEIDSKIKKNLKK